MKYINPINLKRSKHFEFFKNYKNPHFNICTDLDITKTYSYTRKNKTSIFTAVLYAVMKTCNYFEEFKYRIEGDKIKVHDTVHPGITVLTDDDLYSNCIFEYIEPYEKFLDKYNTANLKAKKEIIVGEEQKGRDDLIFISSLPWINFTSVTNPMSGNPDDSIPRIIIGKHSRKNNKIILPFSIQVHHALMDGVHVAKFLYKLSDLLNEPGSTFSDSL